MSYRGTCTPGGDDGAGARGGGGVPVGRDGARQRGAALPAVLLVLALGLAVTGVLVLLSSAEVRLAAADRDAAEARYAAEAALDRAVLDLQAMASWTDALGGLVGSSFSVGAPVLVAGASTVDLEAERSAMQARTAATSAAGANTPQWRLFAWGPLADALPATLDLRSPIAVAVWIADDEAEVDGDSGRDTNQAVWVRAVAYGPGGGRRVIDGLVARTAPAPASLRRLIWREGGGG